MAFMNASQDHLRFELFSLPSDAKRPFILSKGAGKHQLKYEAVRERLDSDLLAVREVLEGLRTDFRTREPLPDNLMLVTLARLENNYYSVYRPGGALLAVGNWKRSMAPPSLLEILTTLLVRASMTFVSPDLRSSMHLGSKGCVGDFTPSQGDVRMKVLSGFVCEFCRQQFATENRDDVIKAVEFLLSRNWLGSPTDPASPARTLENLGYRLFLTKGLRETTSERLLRVISDEGVRQVIQILGTALVVFVAIYAGVRLSLF